MKGLFLVLPLLNQLDLFYDAVTRRLSVYEIDETAMCPRVRQPFARRLFWDESLQLIDAPVAYTGLSKPAPSWGWGNRNNRFNKSKFFPALIFQWWIWILISIASMSIIIPALSSSSSYQEISIMFWLGWISFHEVKNQSVIERKLKFILPLQCLAWVYWTFWN